MKKSFLLIILIALSQFGLAQKQEYTSFFKSEAQISKYLADNIVNLDPIEGVYDVQHIQKNGSPYVANHTENWTYFIVKDPNSNIFTIYTDSYDYGICKSENVRIEQIGETNTYRIYYRNSSTRAYLENRIRLYAQIDLSKSDAKYYADNPFFSYWITISYDMIKKYPTSSMYTNIAREITDCSGTGFALNNNYIVTNYHVVEDAKSICIQGINGDSMTKFNASVVATDKINDLAILKIEGANITNSDIPYSVKTLTSDAGENIFVLGYPLTSTMGEEVKLTTGVVCSKTGFQGDVSLYQISAPIQPGNSGAPLFDENGNIIGIVSSKHIGAENVGYAIKTSYLKNLIESVLSENILPQTNKIASYKLSDKVKSLKNYVYYITCSKRESNTNDSTNDSSSQPSMPSTSMGNSKIRNKHP